MKDNIWVYFWVLVDIELKDGKSISGYIFSDDFSFKNQYVYYLPEELRRRYINAESLDDKATMIAIRKTINMNDIKSIVSEVDKACMAVTSSVILNTPVPKSLQKTFKRAKNKYGFYRVVPATEIHKYTDVLPDDYVANKNAFPLSIGNGRDKFDM